MSVRLFVQRVRLSFLPQVCLRSFSSLCFYFVIHSQSLKYFVLLFVQTIFKISTTILSLRLNNNVMSWVTWQFVSILQRACGHHNRDSALCNNICFNLHVVYMVSYEIHNQNIKFRQLQNCHIVMCFRAVLRIRKKPDIQHCEVSFVFSHYQLD